MPIYALESPSEQEGDYEEDLEDFLNIQEVIISGRYLLSRNSAGRHNIIYPRLSWYCIPQPILHALSTILRSC